MDGSHVTHIIMESGPFTSGHSVLFSLENTIIKMRLHVLLATATRSKHLKLFLQLEMVNDTYVHLIETLKMIQASPSLEKMKHLEGNKLVCSIYCVL